MQKHRQTFLGRHQRWASWRPDADGIYMGTFTVYKARTNGRQYYAQAIRDERFGWLWYLYRDADGIVANGRADSLLDAIDKMDEEIDSGRA